MYLNKLLEVVKLVYFDIYKEKVITINKVNNLKYQMIFKNEIIEADNSTGNKFRLTFNDYVGTIDKFREKFDNILGFVNYCCDTSNFVDLTESFINSFINYYESH